MNYAIQSNNLEIVKYIYDKGYGITVSNLITSINTFNISIVKFIIL